MDAVDLPLSSGAISVSKMFDVKGFSKEGLLVGEDKSRVVKQKHGLDGKRGDKKNIKAPMKTKLDSFFSKNGLASSNSSSGGNNILGIYGLKSDIHAVTKHVDELSLNELLDGSYKCPILSQDRGKKAGNTNENILHSVRKVCSIIQPQRIVRSQNDVELDCASRKMDTCLLESGSCLANRTDFDKGDNNMAEKKSSCKVEDSCSEPAAPAGLDAFLLHQPNVILEQLALQQAKDLESLLLDASKPVVSSRNTPDLRADKPIPYKGSVPPFSWSHPYTGSYKTNMDMSKLTNRSTCQGRWVRTGSTGCTQGDDAGCFSDLDVFACDHNLVSLSQLNLGFSKNETTLQPVRPPWSEQGSSSKFSHFPDKSFLNGSTVMTSHHPINLGLPHKSDNYLDAELKFGVNMGIIHNCSKAEGNLKFGENGKVSESILPNKLQFQEKKDKFIEDDQWKRRKSAGYSVSGCDKLQLQLREPENSKQDEHSPRLLAAAQILHEIRLSCIQNQSSAKIRWPKKLSQKGMKARKSRSPLRKTEVTPPIPKSITVPSEDVMNPDRRTPSKKPRFCIANERKDIAQIGNSGRAPIKWSNPTTSSRSSPPSRLEKGLVSDTKKLNTNTIKSLGMVPTSTQVLDKLCNNSQQKLRKPLFIDWGRGRNKKE